MRLREWKQENRPNEVEKPLTKEGEAELEELMYRFHPLGSFLKAVGWGGAKRSRLQKKAAQMRLRSAQHELLEST